MQHNGKLLVRPDSGDMVEIAVETIEKLWNTFGGTVNSKGYKILDSHIGIIYGDGCTLNNVKQVWEELKKKRICCKQYRIRSRSILLLSSYRT